MGKPTSSVCEAIRNQISIVDYAQKCGYTLTHVGNQLSLKEMDSIRIDPEKNIFFRHSTGKGGSVIDFEMEANNVDMRTAISNLRKHLPDSPSFNSTPPAANKPKPEIPQKPTGEMERPEIDEGRFNRVFAYLCKSRHISPKVVEEVIHRRQLFQGKENGNCVFIGYDKDHKAAFGSLRGTNSNKVWRRDLANSRKEVGWYINNKSATLLVCEAPIDAMSMMTMFEKANINPQKYDYLAVGGTCTSPIKYNLERLPEGQIKTIYLGFDRDDAGNAARETARQILLDSGFKGSIRDRIPKRDDWNSDLKDLCEVEKKVKNIQTPKTSMSNFERSITA